MVLLNMSVGMAKAMPAIQMMTMFTTARFLVILFLSGCTMALYLRANTRLHTVCTFTNYQYVALSNNKAPRFDLDLFTRFTDELMEPRTVPMAKPFNFKIRVVLLGRLFVLSFWL